MGAQRAGRFALLLVLAALFMGAALWQMRAPAEPGREIPQKLYAYEVAGSAGHPGMYRFEGPRNLGELLAQAGAEPPPPDRANITIANGSRVTVGERLEIGLMRAQDRLNCFVPLDIRAATAEDLQLIPGIGEKTAGAIIAYRDRVGFRDISGLRNIDGIGPGKAERLKKYLTVSRER